MLYKRFTDEELRELYMTDMIGDFPSFSINKSPCGKQGLFSGWAALFLR